MEIQKPLEISNSTNEKSSFLLAEPSTKVIEWIYEEVNQVNSLAAYGKHDAYSKSVYSKSFGQYSKS